MLPQPPQPWSGERNALTYAGHAPQSPNRPKRRPELGPADATPEGEDCLTLFSGDIPAARTSNTPDV